MSAKNFCLLSPLLLLACAAGALPAASSVSVRIGAGHQEHHAAHGVLRHPVHAPQHHRGVQGSVALEHYHGGFHWRETVPPRHHVGLRHGPLIVQRSVPHCVEHIVVVGPYRHPEPYRAYHAGGRLAVTGTLIDGRREGLWTWYHDCGQRSREGQYRNGVEIGSWRSWHANGQLAEEGSYRDGRQHGSWTRWHPCGQLAERVEWRDGYRDGSFQSWHANGRLAEEGLYRDGQRSGHWRSWHANGRLAGEGPYRCDQRHGQWTFFDERGRVIERICYDDGRVISHGHGR